MVVGLGFYDKNDKLILDTQQPQDSKLYALRNVYLREGDRILGIRGDVSEQLTIAGKPQRGQFQFIQFYLGNGKETRVEDTLVPVVPTQETRLVQIEQVSESMLNFVFNNGQKTNFPVANGWKKNVIDVPSEGISKIRGQWGIAGIWRQIRKLVFYDEDGDVVAKTYRDGGKHTTEN